MKRLASNYLKTWINHQNRKPLVIRGARQVGKTELVRRFCQDNALDLIEINLEEKQISEFKKESNFDLSRAINEILALTEKKLTAKSLIFLDEIQECTLAYERLRFFKEQRPDIPVIVAGSLLELVLQNEKIKAPVGRVEYLFLGPMTFGEFLLACGRTVFYEQLSTFNIEQINNPITLGQHKELLELLKQYFFVGGMPEVVKLFVESNFNYLEARKVQEQIIESYKEDISKYTDGKIRTVIQEVFDKFPKFIGQKNKYQNYSEEKSIYVSESLNVLEAIFWIQKVYHSNASGLPLKQGENLKIFKSYHLDIGLYNCQMNLKWNDFAFLGENEILTKGMIAEQFIAQHLFNSNAKTTKYHLNYWLKDQSTQKAEVDFMLAEKKLYPIEVKAGKIGKIKSLISFIQSKDNLNLCPIRFDAEYRSHFQEHIDYRSGDKIINFQLTSYPLYLVEFWNK